ncbi:NAD(P)H-dependent oxidoreductase [Cohnella suwonensis]|uniref:NAD(P)H-dependent oxidoreductase n=1 Tax=Cohnella suwonensis TaxID=696072 RepID=A0ABW0LVF3_9BACL
MKTIVISAHPNLERSRANQAMANEAKKYGDVAFRDLYQEYPDWTIDVKSEQELLLQYDRIVLQFPFYWYSAPPLLKKWFDDVLAYGWAFGPGGDHLKGKEFIVATTAGGTENAYRAGGENLYTVSELLRPIQRTLTKCDVVYLPSFVTYNANAGSDAYIAEEAIRFAEHIRKPAVALVQ